MDSCVGGPGARLITVVCVEVQEYCGRGREYVQKLRSMVARHLSMPHRFVCISDRTHEGVEVIKAFGNLRGWWAKTQLFFPGLVSGRCVFFDLDTVIVDSLDELVQHKGILHLDRWGWERKVYGSGVMVWDGGEHSDIWSSFTDAVPRKFEGDQDWITSLGGWPALPDGICVSYRYHSKQGPPPGASVVAFHGRPKCHEVTTGWVPQAWR